MSDGTNIYNRLLGYYVWIERKGSDYPELVFYDKEDPLVLPITGKEYVVTLRNLKLYLEELRESDSSIEAVMIDRLSRVGKLKFGDEDNGEA